MSRRKADDGFTLVELVVASMLLVLLLGLVGGLVLSSLTAERTVRTTSLAVKSAQSAAGSILRGVRSASAMELLQPATDVWVLRLMIVDEFTEDAAVAHCEAWYLGGGEVRTTRSAAEIPVPSTSAAVGGWTLLTTGVTAMDGRPMASLSDRSLQLEFQVTEGQGTPVLIKSTAVSRQVDPRSGQPAPLPAPLQEDQCL